MKVVRFILQISNLQLTNQIAGFVKAMHQILMHILCVLGIRDFFDIQDR